MLPNKKVSIFVFAALLFVVLPLAFVPQLHDVTASASVIVCSLVGIAMSVILFINPAPAGKLNMAFIKHPCFYLFFAFVLVQAISISNSINAGNAFFEWFRLLMLLAIYFLMCICFQTHTLLPVVLQCMNIVAPVLYCISIYQLNTVIIPEAIKNNYPWSFDYRFAASFGNKNNFAQVLLFSLPFFVLSIFQLKKMWKGLAVFNGVTAIVFILACQSLSVFVAAFISVFLLTVLLLFKFRNHNRFKPVLILITSFIILASLGWVFNAKQSNTTSFAFAKAKMAVDYVFFQKSLTPAQNSNSVFERLLLWKNSFLMIKEKPVTGWGLSNWKVIFPKYGYSGAVYLDSDTIKFTKAHNDFLEIWCESGIFALLCMLLLFTAAFSHSLRIIVNSTQTITTLSGIVPFFVTTAFFSVSLFDFPFSRTYQLLLLLTAFSYLINLTSAIQKPVYFSVNAFRISALIIFAASCFTFRASASRLSSELYLQKAGYFQLKKNWPAMQRSAKLVTSYYFQMDDAATPVNWYKATAAFMLGHLPEATRYFELAHGQAPYHVQVLNDLATCYDKEGQKEKAIAFYQRALSINPRFTPAILNLTAMLFNAGSVYEAHELLRTYPDRYKKNLQFINFKTVILGQIFDNALKKSNPPQKVNPEWKQQQWLFSAEAKADSSGIPFAVYIEKVISQK